MTVAATAPPTTDAPQPNPLHLCTFGLAVIDQDPPPLAGGAGERAAGASAKCRLFFLSAPSVGMMDGSSGVAVRREVHLGGMG
jgi:hypothetical protein